MSRRWILYAAFAAACGEEKDSTDDLAASSETDTDADADADTDADTDADADTDTGTAAEDDRDGDGSLDAVDCAPDDPEIWPGAPDRCGDDRVTNCDRSSDDGLVTVDGVGTFTDLQDALDAAVDGSEVRVCPGTWGGTFAAFASIDLVSQGGADRTVLQGPGAGLGDTLTLWGGEGTSLTGFTVTGGGTGIRSASVVITDCVVTGNVGADGGGIRLTYGADAVIASTTITGNVADNGGGLYVEANVSVDLTGSSVEGNVAENAGGIQLGFGSSLVGGRITGNEARNISFYEGNGGGIGILDGMGTVTVSGTEIDGNIAYQGAGIAASAEVIVLTDVSVHDNSVVEPYGVGGGLTLFRGDLVNLGTTSFIANDAPNAGGAYVTDGTITGGSFTDNVASYYGGGLAVLSTGAEAISLVDLVVERNAAETGGGVYVTSTYAEIRLIGGRFASNTATRGGGIARTDLYQGRYPLTVDGVEVVDNVAVDGGGFYAGLDTIVVIASSVLRNQATRGGGAIVVDSTLDPALLVSVATDWGVDADDNMPGDVFTATEVGGYGTVETFDCSPVGCQP